MKQKEYNKDTEIDYVKLIYTFPPLYAKSAAAKQRFLLCAENNVQKAFTISLPIHNKRTLRQIFLKNHPRTLRQKRRRVGILFAKSNKV